MPGETGQPGLPGNSGNPGERGAQGFPGRQGGAGNDGFQGRPGEKVIVQRLCTDVFFPAPQFFEFSRDKKHSVDSSYANPNQTVGKFCFVLFLF